MRIISFIEDREVIQAILKHLGMWRVKARSTPKAHAPPALNQHGSGPAGYVLDHFSQLPMNDDPLHRDPDYPWNAYLQRKKRRAIGIGRNWCARMTPHHHYLSGPCLLIPWHFPGYQGAFSEFRAEKPLAWDPYLI